MVTPNKRPFLAPALLYMAGILLADSVAAPPLLLLGITLGLASLALARPCFRPRLVAPLLVLAGATNLSLQTVPLTRRDLRKQIGDQAAYLTLAGKLVSSPQERSLAGERNAPTRTMVQLEVLALRQGNDPSRPATGRVLVLTPGVLGPDCFGGREVEVAGVLRRPDEPSAPGLFDFRRHLRRRSIHYLLQAASSNAWRVVPSARPVSPPLADRFLHWARQTLGRGLPEDEYVRLLWAMTLGWKPALSGELAEPFMRSGTLHLFAISGLHITLIATMLTSLLRGVHLPRPICGSVLIPALWFYTAATGWQASAIRATVMSSVLIAGWALHRPADLLNSLAAAAFLLLLADPQQLFQVGFQLSFAVVLNLALCLPLMDRIRPDWFRNDPLRPPSPPSRLRRWMKKSLDYLVTSFTMSLAAWLGSLPLVALHFHYFTPVTLLANLVVVPLASLALMANLASLMVGGWWPGAAELFNHSAWFWMLGTAKASAWAAGLPGAWLHVPPLPVTAGLLYYTALLALLNGWFGQARLRRILLPLLGLGVAASLIEWSWLNPAARLTVLPLHGGQALHFADRGSGHTSLIDCGSESDVQNTVKAFLRAQGVNRLDDLVLTHGDMRHVGGASLLARSFRVHRVVVSPLRFRSAVYRQICQRFAEAGSLHHVQVGDAFGPWQVLHPASSEEFSQADEAALVLRGRCQETSVLLLSDLGRKGQSRLINRFPKLRADIVITGLPSATEPVSTLLLETLQPQVVIVADSLLPAAERASRPLQQRLARLPIPVLYTHKTGALALSFRNKSWTIRGQAGFHLSSRPPRRPAHPGWFRPGAPAGPRSSD